MPFLHKPPNKFQSNKIICIKSKNGYQKVSGVNSNTIYEGLWKNNLKHGFGMTSKTAYKKRNILKYQGNWHTNKQNGEGNYHYKNGGFYVGEWKYSKRHGYGSMWYANGSFYDGDWEENVKSGLGIFVQVNGNRYEGEWKNNDKNGMGRFFFLDTGQLQEGFWENGIAICSIIRDIPFRQTAVYCTEYPICQIKRME